MNASHARHDQDEAESPVELHRVDTKSRHALRTDSGYMGSDSTSPPEGQTVPLLGKIDLAVDTTAHYSFVDDDLVTLRKQLQHFKTQAPHLQVHAALLNKRPALATRRTRSSIQIKPAAVTPNAIFYFTSLHKFRLIRDVVHSIFSNSSHLVFLPEVYVLPKPVGPRRLLTALHTSVKRPLLDPAAVPIATSPSSPGGHFFLSPSNRPSPAISGSNQDFEAAFAEGARSNVEARNREPSSPATGPTYFTPRSPSSAQATGESSPPSPQSASADVVGYMELMSKTTNEFGGSASSGIVIQSPDGRPSGLFFHPNKRGASSTPGELRASADRRSREPTAESELAASLTTTSPLTSPPVISHLTPRQLGLGKIVPEAPLPTGRVIPESNVAKALDAFPFTESPPKTDATTSKTPSPLPSAGSPTNQSSSSGSPSLASPSSTPRSPRISASPTTMRSPVQDVARESVVGQRPGTGISMATTHRPSTASTAAPSVVSPRPRGRRRESKTETRARQSRRPTNPVVPPIKVLIVEGQFAFVSEILLTAVLQTIQLIRPFCQHS